MNPKQSLVYYPLLAVRYVQYKVPKWGFFLPLTIRNSLLGALEAFFNLLYHLLVNSRVDDYNFIEELIYEHLKQNKSKGTVVEKDNKKVAIITGANSGIGYETTLALAKAQFKVIMACRSQSKTLPALEKIKLLSNNNDVYFIECDLSSKDSVLKFVEKFSASNSHLNLLINNAGSINDKIEFTKDNIEVIQASNHLGHFLLALELENYFVDNFMVINVSSSAHYGPSDMNLDVFQHPVGRAPSAYAYSKLANCLFTKGLTNKWSKKKFTTVAMHPGGVMTNIYSKGPKFYYILVLFVYRCFSWLLLDPRQGAVSLIYLALGPESETRKLHGKYFSDLHEYPMNDAVTAENANALWKKSLELLKLN